MAGPFDTPPFQNFLISPIGLVPKKNSDKFRTIFHLSYPKSGSTSINSSISKQDFSLQCVTIDDAIKGIKRFGPGSFLAKTDVESAFRLIPVHPDDYELLGMKWEGRYYYDKVLLFGYVVPLQFSTNSLMVLNGFCLTNVIFHSYAIF